MLAAMIDAVRAADRYELWARLAWSAKRVCEVGVWKGEFAERLLKARPAIQRYYMIDPWRQLDQWNKPFNVSDDEFANVMMEALARTDFARERRVVCRGTTLAVAKFIPQRSLDLCYIDGDHTLRGILVDLVRMYEKVRDGGIVGGDDLVTDPWVHGPKFEPTLVFPTVLYFAEATGSTLFALPHRQFALLVDRGRDQFEFRDLTGRYGARTLRELRLSRSDATIVRDQ